MSAARRRGSRLRAIRRRPRGPRARLCSSRGYASRAPVALPVVPQDCLLDAARAAVVQQEGVAVHGRGQAESPQRRACASRADRPRSRAGRRPSLRPGRAAAGRCRGGSCARRAAAAPLSCLSAMSGDGTRRSPHAQQAFAVLNHGSLAIAARRRGEQAEVELERVELCGTQFRGGAAWERTALALRGGAIFLGEQRRAESQLGMRSRCDLLAQAGLVRLQAEAAGYQAPRGHVQHAVHPPLRCRVRAGRVPPPAAATRARPRASRGQIAQGQRERDMRVDASIGP